MPTQVQVRGAVTVTQVARTLAPREIDVDTTLKRINIHDGSSVGGIPHANYSDIQKNNFRYAVCTGTNALTCSFSPAPSLQAGVEFRIKTAAANTGAVTLNPNSLGAVSVKKMVGGSKVALASGDLISGMIYGLFYDGTDFVISVLDHQPGLTSISQGNLNTSSGTFSYNMSSSVAVSLNFHVGTSTIALPAGQYGLGLESAYSVSGYNSGWFYSGNSSSYTHRATAFEINRPSPQTVSGRERYVTSSPPFDLGDGEAGGFIYVLVNNAGEIMSHYAADVPPWGYNGPTNIRCDYKCPKTHKKFKRSIKKRTTQEIMDGVQKEYFLEEITQDVKNADMTLIPHPFGNNSEDLIPILLDPMDIRIRNLIEAQNDGENINAIITGGYLKIKNERLKRKGPMNLMICGFNH